MSDGIALSTAIKAGETTARAAAEAALAAAARHNPALNAFTAMTAERARSEADAVDARIAAGGDAGPLAGIPYAVKNLYDVEGLTTLAGSRSRLDAAPARADATAVARLKAAGAVLIGTLNMDEFAYGFTTENSHFGPCRNPHDLDRVAGGSSGGSAAAVAAGIVPVALGSDTNGSIRVPASLCGVFGLKPTFGRLSRAGTFPFVASLDHVGPLAGSARDLAAFYDAMQGPDPADPVCQALDLTPSMPSLNRGIEHLRFAVADGYFARGGAPEAFEAVAAVAEALKATARVELPEAQRARAAAFVITTCEGASLHRELLRRDPAAIDPLIRPRILAGALAPAAWLVQAQRFRRWFRRQVLALFETCDLIIAPATPVTAPRIGQDTIVIAGEELPMRASLGIYTQPISFIGLPVVTVPVPRPGGLPIGVQIIAPPWFEARAMRVACYLERVGVAAAPLAAVGEAA